MPITKIQLEIRLVYLRQQAEQLKQQFVATTGAMADIEYWLSELNKPDPEPKE